MTPWRRVGAAGITPVIRDALASDLAGVRRLLAATWADTYDGLLGPECVARVTAQWHSLERLSAQLGQPGTAFLVAAVVAEPAGTGFAHMTSDDEAEIGRLYVLPDHQGVGIGAQLLEALMQRLHSARRFHLEVEPRNARAIRFYERHGFTRAGMTRHCGGDGSGIAAVVMQRFCERR